MGFDLLVKAVRFMACLVYMKSRKRRLMSRKSIILEIESNFRFVEGLQERIKFLESQLNATRQEGAIQNHLQMRRSSDHDRDHSAAAALSSLARVPTPTVVPFTESAHVSFRPASTVTTPQPLIGSAPADGNENETYEWDEGGDEKELGTDAMGVASTRDYKPGFFGFLYMLSN